MAMTEARRGGVTFDPDPEHELLRETVRAWFKKELPHERIREIEEDRKPIPRELWKQMGEMGWLGLTAPEEYGGGGAEALTSMVLMEELGRHWASLGSDWVIVSMMIRLLVNHGSEDQRRLILPGLVSGDLRCAVSLSEPGGGTDLLSLRTRAELKGGEWVLNGQKLYTSGLSDYDYICVLCRTDEPTEGKMARGLSMILVKKQEALTVRKLRLLGMRSAGTSEVWYDDARTPEDHLVGERGRGFYHLIGSLNDERIMAASNGIGTASAAFDLALQYAKDRTAFERPIGQFQAIQHYLADMKIDLEQSRLLTQKAAWLLQEGRPCSMEACMAKVSVAEMLNRVTDKGMRILAGHGMTDDGPMERYFRDARLQPFSPMSNEMGRNTIGEMLGLPRSY
jgi:acyl-CoA dehydrogenase